MLKKILLAFGAIIVAILVVAAFQPPNFRIERSTVINAPAERVFAQINDFHNWQAWSPWAKLDPNAKNTFEGPASGVGASFTWSGNDEVGEGRMTVTEVKPNSLIQIKLEFMRPMEDTNLTEFAFVGDAEKTSVLWSMSGEKNFVSKIFCLFFDMDKTVGGDFEKGLAMLKSVVEGNGVM